MHCIIENDIGTAFKNRIDAKEDFGIGYNFNRRSKRHTLVHYRQ